MTPSDESDSGARPLEPYERIVRVLPDGTWEELPRPLQEVLAVGLDWVREEGGD